MCVCVCVWLSWQQADNWRERALDMMMAGRLETNTEEELFKVCTLAVP